MRMRIFVGEDFENMVINKYISKGYICFLKKFLAGKCARTLISCYVYLV